MLDTSIDQNLEEKHEELSFIGDVMQVIGRGRKPFGPDPQGMRY